jgi:TRAP transporter TAXI family solute receptor
MTEMKISTLGASAAVALSLTTSAGAQTVSIVTTPAGSYTNAAGSAIAKVLIDKGSLRAVVQAQAALALIAVAGGVAEFGMSNNFDTTFYATGTGDYEGQPPKRNIRNAATLMPYKVALHVRADSNIRTIGDLKGKRVSSGFNAQKTIGRIIEAHLANAGMSYKDVVGVPAPNVSRSLEDFESGKVDVLFFALGSAATKQASASVGGLRVLPIEDSEAAIKRMQEILPGSYMNIVNPAPEFDGISAPTKVVTFDMVLSTAAEVPETVVYKAVKALYEGKKELAATFAPFNDYDPSGIAKPVVGVGYHPGAIKFFQEAGIQPKS